MNIIIIGNGPSVLDRELGDEIDQFDIVVRLNKYCTDGYEKNIGTKTSIWGRSDAPDIKDKDYSLFKKTIIFIPSQNYERKKRLDRVAHILSRKDAELCPKDIADQTRLQMGCRKGEWPSTGALAINYFIINSYDNIFIHGFDGFLNHNKLRHYYDDRMSSYKGHNRIKEKKFIMSKINNGEVNIL